MLTCLLFRRRIGAYLDGALEGRPAHGTAAHLDRCARCRAEAEALTRLRTTIRQALSAVEPDWTGFWPAIVRGIQDARRQPERAVVAPATTRRARWALAGVAAVVVLAVPLTLWELGWIGPATSEAVVVTSAHTDYAGGTMVYSVPNSPVKVVWVFDE